MTWTSDPGEVRRFAHVLYAARKFQFCTVWDVLDYFDHPDKWDDEHDIWEGWYRPDPHIGTWDLFARSIADVLSVTDARYSL